MGDRTASFVLDLTAGRCVLWATAIRSLSSGMALELCLTGDLIDADRALMQGLINRIVPHERVLDKGLSVAGRVTANAPLALREVKRLVLTTVRQSPEDAWPYRTKFSPSAA